MMASHAAFLEHLHALRAVGLFSGQARQHEDLHEVGRSAGLVGIHREKARDLLEHVFLEEAGKSPASFLSVAGVKRSAYASP